MTIERIQLRRGTAQQWTDTNPILGAAEVGVELGTPNKFKIGDGSSTWSELEYFIDQGSIPTTDLTGYATETFVTTAIGNLIDSAPSTLDTLNEIALALGEDPNFAATILGALGDKSDIGHTHTKSEITDFAHTHTKSDITDFAHTHLKADITDFDHGHDASEITNTIKEITASTYSLVSSDNGILLILSPAASITVTVDDVFTVGQRVDVYSRGDSVTFAAGSGVTIEGAGVSGVNLVSSSKYSPISITCISSGLYALVGSIESA